MAKVLCERRDRITYITLNRPQSLNAMDPEMTSQLVEAWTQFEADEEAWCAIITGAGDRSFCVGRDLKTATQVGSEEVRRWLAVSVGMEPKLTTKPTIAAINGFCLGGGLLEALACDIRIAAQNATLGLPEIRRAMVTPIEPLIRLIPFGHALYLLLTGESLTAEEALRMGLVSKVVPKEDLMSAAEHVASMICESSPLITRLVKESATVGQNLPAHYSELFFRQLRMRGDASEDRQEGPLAFAEKRKPVYKGR